MNSTQNFVQAQTMLHRDHKLGGSWKGHRECHVEPDWLLIYYIDESKIIFERLGSHSELFK